MRLGRYLTLLVIMGCLLSMTLCGCSNTSTQTGQVTDDRTNNKLNVVVSILPQADLVEMIGGENVNVTVMIPPGANPDSFEPSTGELKTISKADLFIEVGHLPFEKAWKERILAANANLIVVNSSEGIKTVGHDPHIWLSPKLAKIQIETICQAIIRADENNKDYYLSNLEKALEKLNNIDQEIASIFADYKGKTFLVYHPAWGYFAKDYGLIEMAIEDHGKEPSPAEMAQIINTAKRLGITTIFTSPQHSTRSAEAIAHELNAKVVNIDPLPSKYEDLINVAQLIKESIGGN